MLIALLQTLTMLNTLFKKIISLHKNQIKQIKILCEYIFFTYILPFFPLIILQRGHKVSHVYNLAAHMKQILLLIIWMFACVSITLAFPLYVALLQDCVQTHLEEILFPLLSW